MKLFVEKNRFHEETLYPMVKYFSESSDDRMFFHEPSFGGQLVADLDIKKEEYSFLGVFKVLLSRARPKEIYFNTFESLDLFVLAVVAWILHVRIIVLAHNVELFYRCEGSSRHSFTSRKIKWYSPVGRSFLVKIVNEFLVLSQSVKSSIIGGDSSKVSVFSTRNLCEYPRETLEGFELNGEGLNFGVIGDILYRKRNYEMLTKIPAEFYKEHAIKVFFLGNVTQLDGPDFLDKNEDATNWGVFYERHLSYAELFYGVRKSDGMLSLKVSGKYVGKVSATDHIAEAFGIPCLEPKSSKDLMEKILILKHEGLQRWGDSKVSV